MIAFSVPGIAQTTKENRKVGEFTQISATGGIKIHFTQENKHSVIMETNADDISKVEAYVKDNTLILKRIDGACFSKNARITAYVSAKSVDLLNVSGGVDFITKKLVCNHNFSINASSGADVEIDKLEAKDCKISISGGAACAIKGITTDNLKLSASGGADADIHVVQANNVAAAASGGADLKISGKTKHVAVSCSGGADADIKDLKYETISSSKSNSGEIRK